MMPRTLRWMLSLAAVCATVACGERVSTEPTILHDASATASRSGGDVVQLLKRDDAIESTTASAVIGPKGGRLQLSDAGLFMDFPRGAIDVPTRITVTALRGRNVAYQ